MNLQILATAAPPLRQQLQWIFYSPSKSAFITCDEHAAFAIPTARPSTVLPLTPARPFDRVHHTQRARSVDVSWAVFPVPVPAVILAQP